MSNLKLSLVLLIDCFLPPWGQRCTPELAPSLPGGKTPRSGFPRTSAPVPRHSGASALRVYHPKSLPVPTAVDPKQAQQSPTLLSGVTLLCLTNVSSLPARSIPIALGLD